MRKETRVSKTGGEEKQGLHDARAALGEAANKNASPEQLGRMQRGICAVDREDFCLSDAQSNADF